MQTYYEHFSVAEAAAKRGVSGVTLRRWDKSGKLASAFRTFGRHRRFSASDVLNAISDKQGLNICYARVSSHEHQRRPWQHRCDVGVAL